MTRENLATASDLLESAADTATEPNAADRLRDLAGQLDTLADRERGPDHGRLARIGIALDEVANETGDDVADEIAEARELVVAFRETVQGV